MKKEHQPEMKCHRLLFYQKPLVGNASQRPTTKSSSLPLQIYSYQSKPKSDPHAHPHQQQPSKPPQGSYQIALPLQEDRIDNHDSLSIRGDAMVITGPENTIEENQIRKSLIQYFLFIAIFNIIITSYLFYNAHISDLSKVMSSSIAPNTLSFVQIPQQRKYSEILMFWFTILNLLFGMIGSYLQSPLGLFFYSLFALLIIFLGFPVVPTLLYSTRYLVDAVNLYIAFVLRSKLMINILPFSFVRR